MLMALEIQDLPVDFWVEFKCFLESLRIGKTSLLTKMLPIFGTDFLYQVPGHTELNLDSDEENDKECNLSGSSLMFHSGSYKNVRAKDAIHF